MKLKVDDEIIINEPKTPSSRHIEFGSESMRVASINEDFVETERRLIKVIEIMKTFNKEYQGILEQSKAISMPQPTKTQP